LNITEAKNAFLFCVQANWACPSEAQRFCKNDSDLSLETLIVTRVESFCEKRDSSRVRVTDSSHAITL